MSDPRRFSTSATSLLLALAVVVLGGCQQTNIETAASTAQVEEPTAVVESPPAEAAQVPIAAPAASPAAPPPAPVDRPAASPPATRPVAPEPAPPTPQLRTVAQPAPAPVPEPLPPVLVTVPVRTVLPIEIEKTLSSHSSQVGEGFQSHLVQDLAVDGRVVFPKGSIVLGKVTEAKPAKKVGGRARLSLEFYALERPDGRQIPLDVVFAEAGKSQTTKDAAIIGGSTLGGAVIGRAVDKGEGTAIGAIVGGLAGAAVANETRAKAVVVNSGTLLMLETTRPITVEL